MEAILVLLFGFIAILFVTIYRIARTKSVEKIPVDAGKDLRTLLHEKHFPVAPLPKSEVPQNVKDLPLSKHGYSTKTRHGSKFNQS